MKDSDVQRIKGYFESIAQLAFDQVNEQTTVALDVEETIELIREDLDKIEEILKEQGRRES